MERKERPACSYFSLTRMCRELFFPPRPVRDGLDQSWDTLREKENPTDGLSLLETRRRCTGAVDGGPVGPLPGETVDMRVCSTSDAGSRNKVFALSAENKNKFARNFSSIVLWDEPK